MTRRAARWLAVGIWLATLAFIVGGLAFVAANPVQSLPGQAMWGAFGLLWVTVGARVLSVRSGNLVGWLFCSVGFGAALSGFAQAYAVYGLQTNPGSLPGVGVAALVQEYVLFPTLAIGPLLFALFPDGHLPGRRWRWIVWGLLGGVGLALAGYLVRPESLNNLRDFGIEYQNPIGMEALAGVAPTIIAVGTVIALVSSLGSVLALWYRFKRSFGDERQQLRWIAFVASLGAALFSLSFVIGGVVELLGVRENDLSFPIFDVLLGGAAITIFLGVPVAAGIAILKYRLYDLDVVVKKTVVYGLLAVVITLLYVGIVAAAAFSTVGTGIAAVVIAVLFQPLRERARRLADRVVYGKRATPYEVLTEFSGRMAEAYSTEDVLPRMAQILGEGTGAVTAEVWLKIGDDVRPIAKWPSDAPPLMEATEPTTVSAADGVVEVRHQGEVLGALAVRMPANDPMNEAKEKLVRDLASQAGLVLRNVRLIEELKESRRRLVRAQDEERRRLERNIHDGAQQQLVALRVRLGLAKALVGEDPDRERATLDELQAQTQDILEDLRDLARGIYPPLLADKGLAAALRGQARKAVVEVEVHADGIGRYPQEAEAAVYFSVLEALQNVAKYSGASRASVRLWAEDGHLSFEVSDEGRGFDPATTSYGTGLQGMADRLEALGGKLTVTSKPGRGTTVSGRVPAEALRGADRLQAEPLPG